MILALYQEEIKDLRRDTLYVVSMKSGSLIKVWASNTDDARNTINEMLGSENIVSVTICEA